MSENDVLVPTPTDDENEIPTSEQIKELFKWE